jgi:uncharacterized protein YggU (UPF0235/DUF167 family)
MRVGMSGVHGDALRVAVLAPPIEGRANAACLEALARGGVCCEARRAPL